MNRWLFCYLVFIALIFAGNAWIKYVNFSMAQSKDHWEELLWPWTKASLLLCLASYGLLVAHWIGYQIVFPNDPWYVQFHSWLINVAVAFVILVPMFHKVPRRNGAVAILSITITIAALYWPKHWHPLSVAFRALRGFA